MQGVRHVLKGSVRKSGNRVRITAQLIEAGSGGHVWAERFDRDLTDIFSMEDEVIEKIVRALAVTLTQGEERGLRQRGTGNVAAYESWLRAREPYPSSAATVRSQPCPPWIAGCDPDHNESRQSELTSPHDYFLQPLSEAHMRNRPLVVYM
jgi:hypothetical protein